MTKGRCVVLDLEAYELTAEEGELLQHPRTAGVILFTRNYHDRKQLRALTSAIKKKSEHCIIAIDQEGGRVQRFREGFTLLPSMASWGEKFTDNPEAAKKDLADTIRILCLELKQTGINLNLIPVLDLNRGQNEVIAERSLHQNPNVIVELASVIIEILHECNMPAVGKHFPGHGAVKADSHLALPIDNRDKQAIIDDLFPFQALSTQLDMVMPAHIVFKQLDDYPATYSPFWLQTILRKQLGFKGVIISDDLSMAGASLGDYALQAHTALTAGVDLVLICNQRAGAVKALESLEKFVFNAVSQHYVQHLMQQYNL